MKLISRWGWYGILFFTILLFLVNLSWQFIELNVVIIGLAIWLYKDGSPILFKEYEAKRKQKLADSAAIKAAAQEALKSGQLFKK